MPGSIEALLKGFGKDLSWLEELFKKEPLEAERLILMSPIPGLGRYLKAVNFLQEVTSGKSVGLKSFWVIKLYFLALADAMLAYDGKYKNKKIIGPITEEDKKIIMNEIAKTIGDVFRAEQLEKVSDHDTGARVNWVKILIGKKLKHLEPYIEGAHFGNTSEDVMSIVFGLILNELVYHHFMPTLFNFCELTMSCAEPYKIYGVPLVIPGFTHKQAAELTILAKKNMNRISAIDYHISKMIVPCRKFEGFSGKLNSSIGNWTAHYAAYPDFDWMNFSQKFVEGFDLTYQEMTDQCVSFAVEAHLFSTIANILAQILKMAEDFHDFTGSLAGFFVKKPKPGVIGSTGMPHKIGNPWNTEGALKMLPGAIDQLHFYSKELQLYKHEGDMGRSSMMRNIGDVFINIFIAINRFSTDLTNFLPAPAKINAFIDSHPSMVVSSIYQAILKREGIEGDAYRIIQNLAHEHGADTIEYLGALESALRQLNLSEELKEEMLNFLKPKNATGKAAYLAEKSAGQIRGKINEYRKMAEAIKIFPIEEKK